MSVIFKEKHYDRLLILLKKFLITALILIIFLFSLNFLFKHLNFGYQTELRQLQQEELKYLSMLKQLEKDQSPANSAAKKYNLLMTLTAYSEDLNLNSLHFKNNKIILLAESKTQEKILKFVDSLKADHNFLDVNLLRLSQQKGYYFQLETIIRQ